VSTESEDLAKLNDREILILTLQSVHRVEKSLEGLASSVGHDIAAVRNQIGELRIELTRDLGQVKTNVDAVRHSLQGLGDVLRGTDFLAHDRVQQLEQRVDALERRPRLVGSNGAAGE
jgi:hypothetical protein